MAQNKVEGHEPDYCIICYTTEIVPKSEDCPADDKTTIELSCKHRFCRDCVRG